jgi:HEPN domain-containing protein
MQSPRLDKYARDARAWQDWAKVNYAASTLLSGSGNPSLYIPAATLAHHALEMYLKSALICEGMTVFNPVILKSLDGTVELKRSDCAWGHDLVELAEHLVRRRKDFNLDAEMKIRECRTLLMPMTIRAGFALFNPFFSELRYPQELKKLDRVGEDERLVLDVLVARLQPFLNRVR